MYFDDRLATVLRTGIGSDRAMCTQFRQLLDLLGTLSDNAEGPLVDAAFARLGLLSQELAAPQRGAMIREPGVRLSSSRLVTILASHEAEVASATMASARLTESAWEALIPRLPLPARGFLRHRQDLDDRAAVLLQKLGIGDLVLPCPDVLELSDRFEIIAEPVAPLPAKSAPRNMHDALAAAFPLSPVQVSIPVDNQRPTPFTPPRPIATPFPGLPTAAAQPAQFAAATSTGEAENVPQTNGKTGENHAIGTLVRRIEAFQRARNEQAIQARQADNAPHIPLHDPQDHDAGQLSATFDFATDANGRINWCEAAFAPMIVGLALASEAADTPAQLAPIERIALRQRQPLRDATVTITGAPAISGTWKIDAHPRFEKETGRYLGHYGRMRRAPASKPATPPAPDHMADRVRQILHELRTPVNAIQGFAEIIQQQLYGPAPHEYRALAATIASDAARILAGFDELDRLARLESGALELEDGTCDIANVLTLLTEQIRPALLPRSSEMTISGTSLPAVVPMARNDAERLCWRLMATLAGEASPGEEIGIRLSRDPVQVTLSMDLPANLAGTGDIFSASLQANQRALSGGMFGSGFTLRLARAEARAAGGDLIREGDTVRLSLPLATGQEHMQDHMLTTLDPTGAKPA